jgi:NAD(P)-dependent dehydrogenase (short-subunit alcohol dehydrogenase family)
VSDEVFAKGRVAVVTGAAMGIGLAAARRFAGMGMRVALADRDADRLARAADEVAGIAADGDASVMKQVVDVAEPGDLTHLRLQVVERWGDVGLLMNNAVTRTGGGIAAPRADWRVAMAVNFWGVLNGVDAFLDMMIAQAAPSMIVNVGSKQGITNPPGNTVYNITKAALKTYTEGLAHELRNTPGCKVSAHLLVPGWTTTGKREHKAGAWRPDQVIGVLLEHLERGDFYIICPDDDVTPAMDRKRILWGAGDLTENRPALSRWHPDFADAFARFEP